ncbi:transporter [Hydrocarboniphaga sp.]|uniref:transporter n=1 Tax=Hydrocarboniphaga sp. TaxID=2033016 RepID=UPI003D0FF219
MRTLFGFAGFALLALPAAASATDDAPETISTDRPDFVESSLTVGAAAIQLETSVAIERDQGFDGGAQLLLTPTLLRVGLGAVTELRLETDGLLHQSGDDDGGSRDGIADLSLGLKYHIPQPGPAAASSAVLLHVDLPSGSSAYRGHGARPSLRYVAEWELPYDSGLGVMPGIVLDSDDQHERYVAALAGITLGHSWTPQLRSFVELAAENIAADDHADTQLSFDTGLAWLLSRDIQLDTAAYVGLNRYTPDFVIAVGISSRW